MKIDKFPFTILDWADKEVTERDGVTGKTTSRIFFMGDIRIRMVEYSAGYLADHWCEKGHVVHCLEGDFITELKTGEKTKLHKGESYVVSDNLSSHRSYSENGVKLLIVDGEFLK